MKITERDGVFDIADFDEFEAYRIASKIEEDGIAFYRMMGDMSEDDEVKEAARFLLSEEGKHLAFFQDLLSALRVSGDDTNEDDDLIPFLNYGVFEPFSRMSDIGTVVTDTIRALSLAVMIEARSIALYRECAQKVSSDKTRRAISGIIEEEIKHKRMFSGLLRKMKDAR